MGLLSAAQTGGLAPTPAARLRWYNLAAMTAALLAAPLVALVCAIKPAWRRGLASRLGIGWPGAVPRPTLWAHAASVGEIEGIGPLVERWRTEHPDGRIVVTALTATGCDVARTILPFAEVRAFPLDLPGIAPRITRRLRPDLFLFSENEIWPNVLATLARMGVPTVQVSGRLSEGAAATLSRFPGLSASVLRHVTRFCVQSEGDRTRLLGLGVDPTRVIVTGSLKGDGRLAPSPVFLEDVRQLGRPIVVAGSTHDGEERIVLSALRLAARSTRPFCILAPRHPERFGAVASLLDAEKVAYVRRTELATDPERRAEAVAGADVLLLDTIGELAGCFPAASACFVGGSFAPIGGHNLLEPARCGVPIVVGPHLDSVRELATRLEGVGALTIARDAADLARALGDHLDRGTAPETSGAARSVAEECAGSLLRTWSCLADVGVIEAPSRR